MLTKSLEIWNTRQGVGPRVAVRNSLGQFDGQTNKPFAFSLEVWNTRQGAVIKVTAREEGRFLGATNLPLR